MKVLFLHVGHLPEDSEIVQLGSPETEYIHTHFGHTHGSTYSQELTYIDTHTQALHTKYTQESKFLQASLTMA